MYVVEGGWGIGVGVGTKRLVGTGQLILSMAPVWSEVCNLAQRATTPSKEFFLIFYYTCVDYLL